jgi:ABC-type branched-subunit amino acid transport system substrate-binding protein
MGVNSFPVKRTLLTGIVFIAGLAQLPGQEGYSAIRSDETRVISGETYFVHVVKRGQTLYALSKAYGVEMQDIIDQNPGILQGLKAGQTLLIPSMIPVKKTVKQPPAEEQPAGMPAEPDLPPGKTIMPPPDQPLTSFTALPCGNKPDALRPVYNVALMMHLYLNELDSIPVFGAEQFSAPSPETIEGYRSLRYIQFYEGFRMAVDSLEKAGVRMNLYVYDVDADPARTGKVLGKPEMLRMDLIIAMLFNRSFQIVAEFAREHHIPVVSPVSEREEQVEGNPMVIKVRPAYSAEPACVADYLRQSFPWAHILIISSPEPDMKATADQLETNCRSLNLDVIMTGGSQMESQLLPGADNIVVIITNQKTFALDILTRLTTLTEDYRFEVVGMPRWDYFENLDLEFLVKSRAHIIAPFFIDYRDPQVQQFTRQFQQRYKTDPEDLAFQGFDVAWYFLNALNLYGTGFTGCLYALQIQPLHTRFRFLQKAGNGMENQHWEIFRYDDYSLVQEDQPVEH